MELVKTGLLKTTLLLPIFRNNLFRFVTPGGIGAEVGVTTGIAKTIYETLPNLQKCHLIDLSDPKPRGISEDGFNQNSEFHNRNYDSTKGFFNRKWPEAQW